MGALLQYISASALSVTLGGNSGVAPFMTLLIVGIIDRIDPSILNMEDWVQKVVSSWPSVVVLGALTIVELVAKCVPCIDAVYEGSMAFVAPILSIFGSVSAFGLFNVATQEQSRTLYYAGQHNMTDCGHLYESNDYYYEDHNIVAGEEFNNHRRLAEKSGWLVFLQVMLCLVGIIISILVHLFKLLMRLIGQGCCTCCITSAEYTWTVTSVIITILIVPIAIATAIILIVAAGVGFKKKIYDERIKKKHEAAAAAAATTTITAEVETDGKKKIDNEKKSDGPADMDEEVGAETKNLNE